MHNLRFVAVFLLVCVAPSGALEREPLSSYRARRSELAGRLKDGITVIFGYTEPLGGSTLWTFRQSDDFYYLTGFNEPGAILMLIPPAPQSAVGSKDAREVLFLPLHNPVQERWTGPKVGPSDPDARDRTGFANLMPAEAFAGELARVLPSFGVIYTVIPPGSGPDGGDFERDRARRLQTLAPFAQVRDGAIEIARMRQVKSPSELALIEKATKASIDAHRQAIKAVHPGVFEYEIAALMTYVLQRQGCERPSSSPVVGSGFNSSVFHYSFNSRRMEAGDVVVVDVAGQYGGYASDIARTLPVSGKFTRRQREIYDIVLGAQKAVIAAIKPGMVISRTGPNSLYRIAYDYLNTHGKDLKGEPLGKTFLHGVGHHVGLSVHDVGDNTRPLEAGMVITVEPGIYLPEEKFGIRIEDIVLVTENGARVLSESLPKDAGEIERLMAGQK